MKFFNRPLLLATSALTGIMCLVPGEAFACLTVNTDTTVNDASNNCVDWQSSNISITGSGTVMGANTAIQNGDYLVGNIVNSGLLDGNAAALNNSGGGGGSGSINTITNNITGIISGNNGIFNSRAINTITNGGSISGNSYGVWNNTGSIGVIGNSGVIRGNNHAGIVVGGGSVGVITNSGMIVSSNSHAIANGSSIGTLSNSGTINGPARGIYNAGTIDTIANDSVGTISGNNIGIYNNGSSASTITATISAISNSGSIGGGAIGILNDHTGYIGTIANNGTIYSSTINGTYGINNDRGTIGAITNSGGAIISSFSTGIRSNYGILGTISNAGTISSSNGVALNNQYSTITAINNNGTISGNWAGIFGQGGTIGTITNNGTIEASNGYGIYSQFINISSIVNNGVIGGSGINNYFGTIGGGITAIDSSMGSIAGRFSNQGTVIGNIKINQDLLIADDFGLLTGGTISTNNHNLTITGTQTLEDDVNLGASNTLTSSGTIRVNATQSITGNLTQYSSARLFIGFTDSTHYGDLVISGDAAVTNSSISIVADNVAFGVSETLTILQVAGAVDYSGISVNANGFLKTTATNNSGGFNNLIVTIQSCGQTISSDATINDSSVCRLTWTGGALSIAGGGTISGASTGVVNPGHNLGTLTNNGVISGQQYGIFNSIGTINTITNNGTISGQIALSNYNSFIDIFTNNGLVSGDVYGVNNQNNTISTISNNGVISSNIYGIHNQGTISQLLNNVGGTISGHQYGIYNISYNINAIDNAGTILSDSIGIYNWYGSTIGGIQNSGVISGASIGIYNDHGTIGNGTAAILSSGTIIGGLNNSGEISGNINVAQSLTITNDVSTTGTLSSGTITTNNHDLIFNTISSQLLDMDVNVGAANTFNMGGTIQANTQHSITGNYVQSPNGILVIGVTDSTHYGDLIISNNTTMTNSRISITGTPSIGDTYTIVQSAGTTDYSGIAISAAGFATSYSTNFFGGYNDLLVTINSCNNQTVNADTVFSGATCHIDWNGGNLSIGASGQISGSATAILNASNTVGNLSNNGAISGSDNGILNTGAIATITNSSSKIISGDSFGFYNNGGTVGAIFNNGTITGHQTGIYDNTGSIGTISNSGIISAINNYGIRGENANITAIVNNGTITGKQAAIYAYNGSISTIENSGLISATSYGIRGETLSIETISNSGTIAGNSMGLYQNNGSIGSIDNNGLITGHYVGLNLNNVTVGTISNSGTIRNVVGGSTTAAIDFGGTLGTLSNNGLITGDKLGFINFGSVSAIINHGTIAATLANSGVLAALSNWGTVGNLSNAGLISGTNAIYSQSGATILSAITNTGTIAGNVDVNQALTFTGGNSATIGTLTGYSGVGTITTNDHDLTFDASAYQFLNDLINVGASNSVVNNGTIRVNAAQSITGNYSQSSGGLLVVGVTDNSNYGKLVVSGSATMTNSHVLIVPTVGALSSGQSFTIVHASDTGTDYTGLAATAGAFTASATSIVGGGFNDLIVSLSGGSSGGGGGTYTDIGSIAGGGVAPGIGSAIDQIQNNIANGGDASFAPVLATLGGLTGTAQQQALQQLGPNQLSPQLGVTNSLINQGAEVIQTHQESFTENEQGRRQAGIIGKAAGSEYRQGVFWGQISGGVANKDSTPSLGGYHQTSYGMTAGVDIPVTNSTTLGIAFGMLHGNAYGKDGLSGTDVSANSYQVTAYGSQRFLGHAVIDGMMGIGYNRYRQDRAIGFLNSSASAEYGGMSYMGKITGGWAFSLSDNKTILTPQIGFQASRTDNDSYTEGGAGPANLSIGSQTVNSYATTLGLKASTSMDTAWGNFTPELKLGWVHDLNDSPIPTEGTLGGVNFATTTPRTSQDGAQLSLGATLQQSDRLAIRVEYNADIRSDYQSHTGLVKVKVGF